MNDEASLDSRIDNVVKIVNLLPGAKSDEELRNFLMSLLMAITEPLFEGMEADVEDMETTGEAN